MGKHVLKPAGATNKGVLVHPRTTVCARPPKRLSHSRQRRETAVAALRDSGSTVSRVVTGCRHSCVCGPGRRAPPASRVRELCSATALCFTSCSQTLPLKREGPREARQTCVAP